MKYFLKCKLNELFEKVGFQFGFLKQKKNIEKYLIFRSNIVINQSSIYAISIFLQFIKEKS